MLLDMREGEITVSAFTSMEENMIVRKGHVFELITQADIFNEADYSSPEQPIQACGRLERETTFVPTRESFTKDVQREETNNTQEDWPLCWRGHGREETAEPDKEEERKDAGDTSARRLVEPSALKTSR
ncbi:hypothetical protein MTO96_025571 [Rhipicephalus appendiculatus]